ncbi:MULTISPECIES: hypothetical protein [unclassified Burkholderia]|uniref:hypothetical protein n=1 Tax=unclassified Burkholderia TaxID=2613784 RepID=UPI002AB23DE5|nr:MULTISPECIES: hypothetical protein [unclassified Burkholderia]
MIVEHNGTTLAFGLRWQPIIGGDATPAQKAREMGSKWFYADSAGEYVGGLLPAPGALPKKVPKLYCGAAAVAHSYQNHDNVLAILALPDTLETADPQYLVVGLQNRKPKAGFDREPVGEDELHEVVTQFMEIFREEGFVLVGDAPLPGIERLTLDEVAAAADDSCLMQRGGKRIRPASILMFLLLGGAVVGGAYFYHSYRLQQLAADQAREQKSPDQLYQEAMEAARALPVVQVTDLDDWYDWSVSLPRQVGGWYFQKNDCTVQSAGGLPVTAPGAAPGMPTPVATTAAGSLLSCTLSFARGPFALATNRSFIEAAPADWPRPSIVFAPSGKGISVTLTRPVSTRLMSTVLNALPSQRTVDIDFRSQAQQLDRVMAGNGVALGDYQVFGLPTGVSPGDLSSPIFAAPWKAAGPARNIGAIRLFPPYLSVEHVVLSYGEQGAQHMLNTSLGSIEVSGQLFAKRS